MSMTRKWSLLTAVLILAVFVASWFLLVAPKRSHAAQLRSDEASQQQANAQLVTKLQELKAQSLDLPKQKAELALIRKQIPDNPALPTLIRDLTAAGKKVGVSIVSLQPSVPVALVAPVDTPVAPVATDPSAADGSATDSAATDSSADVPAPAPVAPAPSVYQVPLRLQVTGSYFEVEQFINKLEALRRSFLVTGFVLKPVAENGTTATGTTTAPTGELTLDLSGRVFLAPVQVAPAASATPTPAASSATTTTQ